MKLNTAFPKNHERNLYSTCALEIAIDCSLPVDLDDWPAGLVYNWNKMVADGLFDGATTIGEIGLVWIDHRRAWFLDRA